MLLWAIEKKFCLKIVGLMAMLIAMVNGGGELDRIVVVMRHGDRAPLRPYSFDEKKKDELWPFGYGHLTKEGKYRMHRIGLFLRRRYYREFPSRSITPRDIYIQSSASERCLESAQLVASGLVPPSANWIWNSDLGVSWQPVPIYTHNSSDDGLLFTDSWCPRAEKLVKALLKSDIVQNFHQTNEKFFQKLSGFIGEPISNHRELRELFDSLLSMKHHQKRLPLWAKPEIYKQMKALYEISFKLDYSGILEPELDQLRTGMLTREIFCSLNDRNHQQEPKQQFLNKRKKLNILVTHDSQIYRLLNANGFKLEKTLKYGVTLLFEFKEKVNNGTGGVRLFKIEHDKWFEAFQAKEMKFAEFENYEWCPLKEWIEKQKHLFLTVTQWREICHTITEN